MSDSSSVSAPAVVVRNAEIHGKGVARECVTEAGELMRCETMAIGRSIRESHVCILIRRCAVPLRFRNMARYPLLVVPARGFSPVLGFPG